MALDRFEGTSLLWKYSLLISIIMNSGIELNIQSLTAIFSLTQKLMASTASAVLPEVSVMD